MDSFGPFSTVADIGTGDGVLAFCIASWCPNTTVTAYDVSQVSLERAKERCAALPNCKFEKIDLNLEQLPRNMFDAVMTTGAMHHIENLDFCFRSLAQSLKPSGLLWLNDYMGPARFQWSDTHMRLANELLSTVPPKWRLRDAVVRGDPETIRATDPSEAVSSHAIEDALFAHFEIMQKFERGGTLLAQIFGSACLSSEIGDTEEGRDMLRHLYRIEHDMIARGALKSVHNLYVGRPRPLGTASGDALRAFH